MAMKRREFITLVGGAAATWPLAARAQQAPKRVLRVGALIGFAEHDPATQRHVAAFLKRLADLDWRLDRNVAIDFRYGAGDADKNRAFAKELVSLNPDVIFVNSTSATAAVQRETTIIPVVFATVSDPVGSGFVASLVAARRQYYRVRQCRGIHCWEVARASEGGGSRHQARRADVQSYDRHLLRILLEAVRGCG
jgi:ABC-type uncharacterized transport system substrate-binding protein